MSERIFEGRTALVTGGSRGIGRAICLRLAADGARIAVNYQSNEAAARQTAERIRQAGGQAVLVQGDVADPAQVAAFVGRVREALGPVDLLVNNAAVVENLPHTAINPAS